VPFDQLPVDDVAAAFAEQLIDMQVDQLPGGAEEGQAEALRARAAAGEAKAGLAREFGISRQTLYSYLSPPVPASS
jgi:hypothetical protein